MSTPITPPTVRAVVFDYGGVLTGPVRHSIQQWLVDDRIEPETFSGTLRAWLSRDAVDGTPIHRLETGELTTAEFEELFAAELARTDGRRVEPRGLLARFFAGMTTDPAMFDLVHDLRTAGVRTALLSNSWGNTYPREEIDAIFDPVVISGEVGLRKPRPEIFDLVLESLGLPAREVLFIDDAEPNIEGARAVGMQALLHTDAAATRAAVARTVPGLPTSPPPATARVTTDRGETA